MANVTVFSERVQWLKKCAQMAKEELCVVMMMKMMMVVVMMQKNKKKIKAAAMFYCQRVTWASQVHFGVGMGGMLLSNNLLPKVTPLHSYARVRSVTRRAAAGLVCDSAAGVRARSRRCFERNAFDDTGDLEVVVVVVVVVAAVVWCDHVTLREQFLEGATGKVLDESVIVQGKWWRQQLVSSFNWFLVSSWATQRAR
jgi:hypothetical protein